MHPQGVFATPHSCVCPYSRIDDFVPVIHTVQKRFYYRSTCRIVRWNSSGPLLPLIHGLASGRPERLDGKVATLRAKDSTCASGAHPRTNCGAGCRYPFATDHGGNAVFFHVRVESYGRTDRGRLLSPDSGGNFRVGVIRHAFHLAQILRAHATRSQVSSWGRAVRRTLKPVTPLEPLMESSRSTVTVSIRSFSGFSGFFGFFRARKVQNFPASFSSSELSAHQVALSEQAESSRTGGVVAGSTSSELSAHQMVSGVIPHLLFPCALVPPSSSVPLFHPRCERVASEPQGTTVSTTPPFV